MKKFSEIISMVSDGGSTVREKSVPVMEAVDNTDALFNELVGCPLPKTPELILSDNPKFVKIANSVISLLDRKAKWKGVALPVIRTIDGTPSIVIMNAKNAGTAVSVTPMGNGNAAVIRYYTGFETENDNQTADYTISAKNMGLVHMFDLLVDVIKNPDAFTKGVYESESGIDGNAINEGSAKDDQIEMDKNNFEKMFNELVPAKSRPYRQLKIVYESGKPDDAIKWCDPEGLRNLFLWFKSNPDKRPANGGLLAYKIFNNIEDGAEICRIVKNGRAENLRSAGAVALAKFIFDTLGIESVGVVIAEQVKLTHEVEKQYEEEYRGLDISFAKYLFGNNIDRFKEAVDKYYDSIDELSFRIDKAVEYCKLPKLEKKKKINVGAMAVIISGIGGVGKSDAWNQVRKRLNLKENVDYAEKGNDSCNAKELYNFVYHNNGLYLVLDDTPHLFDTGFQASFWKKALDSAQGFPIVNAPSGKALGEGVKGNFYSLADCMESDVVNCKKRYFKECPKDAPNKYAKNTEEDEEDALRTKIRYVPDTVDIQSKFLIITNSTEADISKIVGKENWDAIVSRGCFKRLAPPVEVIWARIKKKLIEVRDTNDTSWFVPPQMVDEVIEIVEKEFQNFGCDRLTWRIFTNGTLQEDIIYGRDWRKSLREKITTQVEYNDELNDIRRAKRKALMGIGK